MMKINTKKSSLATAMSAIVGVTLPSVASAVGLGDGYYTMSINNTPYTTRYEFGSDGAWNSSFTFASLPGINSLALYDDTVAHPVNGKYAGVPNDGVSGSIGIRVEDGVITDGYDGTNTNGFEFDTIWPTLGGDFTEYGDSIDITGTIDPFGNISLTLTGLLATVSDFPSLVDKAWNIDNFNGTTGSGTDWVVNPPNSNTAYDAFSTVSATNAYGTINGAAYDGTTAILVKGGSLGTAWEAAAGLQYFEVWNISFTQVACLPAEGFQDCLGTPSSVPIPPAAWLFGSGLMVLGGLTRKRKQSVG